MKEKSKTEAALSYMARNPKATVYEAAKVIGVSNSVLYRAVAARNRPRCKCCGQYLPTT